MIQKRLCVLVIALLGAQGLAASQRQQQHTRLFPPENLGLLEGPDRDEWQRPDRIMDELRIAEGSVVGDLGAGSGWFTVRLASRVGPNGKVYAEDIQPEMFSAIKLRVQREGWRNVEPVLGTASDPRFPKEALDAILIVASYYEMDEPIVLLRNVARALKPTGLLGIVDFTKEGFGPGPPMEERVEPEQIIRHAEAAGLKLHSRPDILPYQYLLIFEKDPVQGSRVQSSGFRGSGFRGSGVPGFGVPPSRSPPDRGQDRGGDENLVEVDRQKRIEAGEECGLETERGGACEQREPGHAEREDDGQAAAHREHRGAVTPIEASFGEPAREERGQRIAQKISAGRTEQTEYACRQHSRGREHRQARNPRA
jgi:ubiquinone/menaquinone biosynthesis C-methylase UbiE